MSNGGVKVCTSPAPSSRPASRAGGCGLPLLDDKGSWTPLMKMDEATKAT